MRLTYLRFLARKLYEYLLSVQGVSGKRANIDYPCKQPRQRTYQSLRELTERAGVQPGGLLDCWITDSSRRLTLQCAHYDA